MGMSPSVHPSPASRAQVRAAFPVRTPGGPTYSSPRGCWGDSASPLPPDPPVSSPFCFSPVPPCRARPPKALGTSPRALLQCAQVRIQLQNTPSRPHALEDRTPDPVHMRAHPTLIYLSFPPPALSGGRVHAPPARPQQSQALPQPLGPACHLLPPPAGTKGSKPALLPRSRPSSLTAATQPPCARTARTR